MYNKSVIYNFITFLLIFTVLFSINSIQIFAETDTSEVQSAENTTETTSSEPAVIKNYAEEDKELTLNSEAAILIDANTGMVIYEKNAHKKLYPASITKILTSYIACTEGNFDDTITMSQSAYDGMGEGGSSIGIVPGEQFNFEDGLYGILLESANEVCMAVAEHMSGSVSAFVDKMNETAKSLGCNESHFANPHGFHDDNHYTTCYDMSLIAKQAITNEDFAQIWGTISYQIPPTNMNETRYLHNKDRMLQPTSEYYYADLLGGKTGFTDEAGNTLVSCGERDGAELITVVMNAEGYEKTYEDTVELMEYGFSLYNDRQTIFRAADYSSTSHVVQTYKDKTYDLGTVAIGAASDIDMALPNFVSTDNIRVEADIDNELTAPVTLNDIVGKINVYYNETLLGSVDAIATTEAPALSDKELAKRELKDNLEKYVMVPLSVLIVLFIVFIVIVLIRTVINRITGKANKNKRRRRHTSTHNSSGRKHRKRRPDNRRPRRRRPTDM